MKKRKKLFAVALCCGVLTLTAAGTAFADPVIMSGIPLEKNEAGPGTAGAAGAGGSSWAAALTLTGPVLQVNSGTILINSISGTGPAGMVTLTVDPDTTLILDAENGYPVPLSEIAEGETVFAYVGPAMTLSLPPQITASMVLCKIPESGQIPLFTKVVSMNADTDGGFKLTGADGTVITVPADCTVLPFLTRNIVTLANVTPGSNCLIWSDETGVAEKIVIIQQ